MAVQPPQQSIADDIVKAADLAKSDPAQAEVLYHGVLQRKAGQLTLLYRTPELTMAADEDDLRDQETALAKLGALYRDHESAV